VVKARNKYRKKKEKKPRTVLSSEKSCQPGVRGEKKESSIRAYKGSLSLRVSLKKKLSYRGEKKKVLSVATVEISSRVNHPEKGKRGF